MSKLFGMKEEMKEQREKLNGQPFSAKLSYFWYYYKVHCFVAIAVIIMLVMGISDIIENSKPTALCGFFLNAGLTQDAGISLADDFASYAGIDSDKTPLNLDTSLTVNYDTLDQLSIAIAQKIIATAQSEELDFIVGDSDVVDYYAADGFTTDLSEILPADLFDQLSDSLYYTTLEDGTSVPIGISLENCKKLTCLGFYPDTTGYLFIVNNSKRMDATVIFLEYLFNK